ncbi:MAG TPA: hypothetical protein VFZ25_16065 [Chloroflexota bacterium]|nr:hypothetical protein [Chloroflexota bacterium]
MDLIGGVVVVTAAFLLAAAVVGHWLSTAPWEADPERHNIVDLTVQRRSQTLFVTLLIAFFVGLADILVAAQLGVIAFINVIVGAATIGIVYSVSRTRRDRADDSWRR